MPYKFFTPPNLVRIIVLLLGIIYGTLHHYRVVPEDLNAAVIATLLFFLVEQFFELGIKVEKTSSSTGISTEVRKYKSGDHRIFSEVLEKTHDRVSEAIRFCPGGFMLSGPYTAILSYAEFWELLTNEKKKGGDTKHLTVLAIHSSQPKIWIDHSLTNRLIESQREFIKSGGKITRVLCGQGAPTDAILNAGAKMRDAGINVRYYNIEQGTVLNYSFTWDFLYVNETRQSVIWNSFDATPGGVIEQATYLDSLVFNKQDLECLWREIYNHSAPLLLASRKAPEAEKNAPSRNVAALG